jgi:hypothetical protein
MTFHLTRFATEDNSTQTSIMEGVDARVYAPDFFYGEHAPFDFFADKSIQMDPDFDYPTFREKNNREHPTSAIKRQRT